METSVWRLIFPALSQGPFPKQLKMLMENNFGWRETTVRNCSPLHIFLRSTTVIIQRTYVYAHEMKGQFEGKALTTTIQGSSSFFPLPPKKSSSRPDIFRALFSFLPARVCGKREWVNGPNIHERGGGDRSDSISHTRPHFVLSRARQTSQKFPSTLLRFPYQAPFRRKGKKFKSRGYQHSRRLPVIGEKTRKGKLFFPGKKNWPSSVRWFIRVICLKVL